MPAKPEPKQNHLLAALSPEVEARLFPYLELVPLPLRSVMYESAPYNATRLSPDRRSLHLAAADT